MIAWLIIALGAAGCVWLARANRRPRVTVDEFFALLEHQRAVEAAENEAERDR